MFAELGIKQRGLERHTDLHALKRGKGSLLGQYLLGGLSGFDDVVDVHGALRSGAMESYSIQAGMEVKSFVNNNVRDYIHHDIDAMRQEERRVMGMTLSSEDFLRCVSRFSHSSI